MCSVGAIRAVATGYTSLPIFRIAQVEKAMSALAAAAGIERGKWEVIRWNDIEGRTFAEIEAVFEKAIEKAEASA